MPLQTYGGQAFAEHRYTVAEFPYEVLDTESESLGVDFYVRDILPLERISKYGFHPESG